jgi:hypothetical protein
MKNVLEAMDSLELWESENVSMLMKRLGIIN